MSAGDTPLQGFRIGPSGLVNLIRDNLRDRYKAGFPILKELIQNADDAHAQRLEIGWTRGIPGDAHELLGGPAVFVVNDGRFTERDAEAISEFGISNRAGERSTIGKFGLGLKSVFHVCEAFFYFASDPRDGQWASEFPRSGVLNPWYDRRAHERHREWSRLTAASASNVRKALEQVLTPFAGGDWFCLWIPLRRMSHRVGSVIEGTFPGDSAALPPAGLFPEGAPDQISQLLPMLHSVNRVRAWDQAEGGHFAPRFDVALADGAERRRFDGTGDSVGPAGHQLTGSVAVTRGGQQRQGRTRTWTFVGRERVLDDATFEQLRCEPDWPIYSTRDREGRPVDVADKAQPHCAVYLSATRVEDPAAITVAEAVFLPVGDAAAPVMWDGPRDVWLTLHGYLFVDAGRAVVADDETTVQGRWNSHLRHRGIYPLVLPTLSDFVRDVRLPHTETAQLTAGIRATALFADPRSRGAICAQHQWLWRLKRAGGEWGLVDGGTSVLEVPVPPERAPDRPFVVLPGLAALCEQRCVSYPSDRVPRLAASDRGGVWPEDALRSLLRTVASDAAFSANGELDYLVKFLDSCSTELAQAPAAVAELERLARGALRGLGLGALRQRAALCGAFMRFIPAGQRWSIAAPDDVWPRLLELDLETLLTPAELVPQDAQGRQQPTIGDGERLLHALAAGGPESIEERSRLALVILAALGDRASATLSRCAALPLFLGYDAEVQRRRLHSWEELLARSRTGRLYTFPPPPGDVTEWADALAGALRDPGLTLIAEPMAKQLLEQVPQPCDAAACFRALLEGVALGAAHRRATLFDRLQARSGVIDATASRRALRYLLHASAENLLRDRVDLVLEAAAEPEQGDPATSEASVWARLAEEALRLDASEWRLLPRQVAVHVTPMHQHALGIQTLGPRGVATLLREYGPDRVACERFSLEERELIVRDLQDEDILRSLPVHELVGNLGSPGRDSDAVALCSIDDSTYLWVRNFALAPQLLRAIRVVRASSDPATRRRQEELAPPLDERAAVRISLRQDDPQRYCWVILDALPAATDTTRYSPLQIDELRGELRATAWVPRRDGTPTRPDEIIWLPGLEEHVERVFSADLRLYTPDLAVDPDIRAHPAWAVARETLLPGRHDALYMFGEALAEDQAFAVGLEHEGQLGLDTWCAALSAAPNAIMAAGPVLGGAVAVYGEDACADYLLAPLRRPIENARMGRLLAYLAERHREAAVHREEVLTVHGWYLREAARDSVSFAVLLRGLELLNRRGRWKPADELCLGEDAPGIDRQNLLDRRQEELVAAAVRSRHEYTAGDAQSTGGSETVDGFGIDDAYDAGATRLRDYFASWEQVGVPRELIGGFLSLLGGDPEIERLAQSYLGNRSVHGTRQELGWQTTWAGATDVAPLAAGFGEDVHEAMARQRCVVNVVTAERGMVPAKNLLGQWFLAKQEEALENLLVGPRFDTPAAPAPAGVWDGRAVTCRRVRLRLRAVDVTNRQEELQQALKETARRVMAWWYEQRQTDLDAWWDELSRSEQLDIDIARNWLLDNAAMYLRQVGVTGGRDLQAALRRWEVAQYRKAEEQRARHSISDGEGVRRIEEEIREALREIGRLLERDQPTQETVLAALRKRMGDYSYTEETIPFELFQNADDAVVELELLTGVPASAEALRFVVDEDEAHLRFMHWGRAINRFASGGTDKTDVGYRWDLQKMLALSLSDKRLAEGAVTGKYGLGFKSVFLISDVPEIRSGRLAFRVLGGMFPQRLEPEQSGRLRELLGTHESGGDDEKAVTTGTLIELPLRGGARSPDKVLERFRRLAGVLLAFSRRIRRCALVTASGTEEIEWQETPVVEIDPGRAVSGGLYVGRLPALRGGASTSTRVRAVVIRAGAQQGAVLLRLGPRGFEPLEPDTPTIWVTAPTRAELDLGLAVNGPFWLDVGRAQLAIGPENDQAGRILGTCLGAILTRLRAAGGEFRDIGQPLGLSPDVDEYEFWDSLWNVLGRRFAARVDLSTAGGHLARLVLWGGPQSGMACLIGDAALPALPTGLWGDHRRLTHAEGVRLAVRGALDREDVFRQVALWPKFCELAAPGNVVSAERVGMPLRRLWPEGVWREVTLSEAVAGEVGERHEVSADLAAQLGRAVDDDLLDAMEGGSESQREEALSLRSLLGDLRFMGRDGRYHESRELLIGEGESRDEQRRAAFAPPERILHGTYSGHALSFFLACRPPFEAPARVMAEWVRTAPSTERQIAGLQYLLDGERGQEVVRELRGKIDQSWLADLAASGLASAFDEREWGELLLRLWLIELPAIDAGLSAPVSDDPRAALARLSDWWAVNAGEWTARYERRVYPDGQRPRVTADFMAGDIAAREEWLALLTHGALHTIGRTHPGADRNFVKLWRDRGWLRMFADPHLLLSEATRVLDEFLADQIEWIPYFHWMRQYPAVYLLARWLSEYAPALLAIDRYDGLRSLNEILRLRANPKMGGGGYDAPPVDQALGSGANFVVRELTRFGVLKESWSHPHCFVPSTRVRALLQNGFRSPPIDRGDEGSRQIHAFLLEHLDRESATFARSFDLPLLALAEDAELQLLVLNGPVPMELPDGEWDEV